MEFLIDRGALNLVIHLNQLSRNMAKRYDGVSMYEPAKLREDPSLWSRTEY